MATTRVTQLVRAPRAAVYAALLDPVAVQRWMVPDDMTSEVHAFDAREGGEFRISLTYDHDAAGKTDGRTDTFAGRFARLAADREVVQVVEFETDEASFQGEMVLIYRLADMDGGTLVEGIHEGLPDAVPVDQNELGWAISLRKLAALVEQGA